MSGYELKENHLMFLALKRRHTVQNIVDEDDRPIRMETGDL